MSYIEDLFKEIAANHPVQERVEFKVKELPKNCLEYSSEGEGDITCPSKLERLSQNVSRCPLCHAVYIKEQ